MRMSGYHKAQSGDNTTRHTRMVSAKQILRLKSLVSDENISNSKRPTSKIKLPWILDFNEFLPTLMTSKSFFARIKVFDDDDSDDNNDDNDVDLRRFIERHFESKTWSTKARLSRLIFWKLDSNFCSPPLFVQLSNLLQFPQFMPQFLVA